MKKLRIPLAFKLIGITIFLLAGTTALIALRSASRFEEISVLQQEQTSRDQSRARATEVEGLLVSYVDKAKIVASLLMKDSGTPEERQRALDLTFGRDQDLVAVEVISKTPSAVPLRVVDETYLKQYKLDKSFVEMLRGAQKARKMVRLEALFSGKDGHIEVRNSTIEGGAPLLTIGFPLAKDEFGQVTHVVLAEVGFDRLKKSFSSQSVGDMFLVDDEGRLLAHSSADKEPAVLKGESLAALPIVKAAVESKVKQEQKRFKIQEGGKTVPYTAAYTRTGLGVTAIAQVSDEIILEAARAVKREAFYIAGQVLSIAFFAIFVFSISITTPIENLAELTSRVAKGDFSAKANVKTRDEVGQLGEAFNHMLEGLLERDKVKSMFNKFHGSSVTEDLLKGNLELGGSKKVVTVFFSDVRDFTKFSEGHTPEEVVEMLNEYFQIMVGIINRNGGVVDKFIGDAIMAVWGAPNSTERDPQNAVRASLEMRQALAELNESRAARGKIPIKIGIGLHRGDAISGTIGSSERMEYTVIGDTVNQASRIEASTKAFGTDLLVSDSLAEFIGEEFIVENAGSVEVKGKSEPLTLYKVRGYYDTNKNPVVISTPFSDYEAGEDAKVKIA